MSWFKKSNESESRIKPTKFEMTQFFETDWGVKIEITKGDITRLDVDCIVNAANNSMLGGGGVDGAIHRAAGDKLLEECRKVAWDPKTKDRCPTGGARLTKGPFNQRLYATDVIHTVGPIVGMRSDLDECSQKLSSCIRKSLLIAKNEDYQSIAFPAISCGIYNSVGDDWSVLAAHSNIDTCVKFIKECNEGEKKGELSLKRIVFIFNDQDLYDFWEAACVGLLSDKKHKAGHISPSITEDKGEEGERESDLKPGEEERSVETTVDVTSDITPLAAKVNETSSVATCGDTSSTEHPVVSSEGEISSSEVSVTPLDFTSPPVDTL